ncbi:MAG: SAM-dependent methyltransferase [Verrucomicrobiota bacterium]
MQSDFLFALTNPRTEKALKLEVESMGLGWRLSYQRKGFVTFKGEEPFTLDSLQAEIACARRLCLSLGKAASHAEAKDLLGEIKVLHQARYQDRGMRGVPLEADKNHPHPDELVGTIVKLGEEEFWTGIHRHQKHLSRDPAGDAGLVMPETSPSRAWLKLEEAIRFFGLQFSEKDIAVELGAAPGGVVLALLNRGVSVIGVDPANLDDVVMKQAIPKRSQAPQDQAWFYHCRKPAALVSKKELGRGVTWFLSDMNQSPEVILKECARFCQMAPTIRGALMTLKLTDPTQVAEKEAWFATLREMEFSKIRLQLLRPHHRELALLAQR